MVRTPIDRLVIAALLYASLPHFALACPELDLKSVSARMETLSDEIHTHDRLYYQEHRSAISDADYDRLVTELRMLEGCYPAQRLTSSPTTAPGQDLQDSTLKVPHAAPMLSLASSSLGPIAVEALLERIRRHEDSVRLLVQPKVDGLPVELTYEAGRLVSAATRGDGLWGQDVTERARSLGCIPSQLGPQAPARVVVRGEVYADLEWLKSHPEFLERYATPRHLASGTLLSDNPDQDNLNALGFFPFELVNASELPDPVKSDTEALKSLLQWGFAVNLLRSQPVSDLQGIQSIFDQYCHNRKSLPFAVDGLVVKVDDLGLRHKLGANAREPLWATAWKFPPSTAQTRITSILWSTGRTGRRTPVAEVDPVEIEGIRISRASLHNEAQMARLGATQGALVQISLAGDVVPVIETVLEPGTGNLGKTSGSPDREDNVLCLQDSPSCRDQYLARIIYFTSSSGLGIRGLGKARLAQLVEAGLLPDIPSLLRLQTENLENLPGIGRNTAAKLIREIAKSRHCDSFRLLHALGIPGIGPAAIKQLSAHFDSLEEILRKEQEEVPPGVAKSVMKVKAFFAERNAIEILDVFGKQ